MNLIEELHTGRLAPWKVEEALSDKGVDRFRLAAEIRRTFLERVRGIPFQALPLPEKPYRQAHQCPKCGFHYDLVAYDPDQSCRRCGGPLTPIGEPQPLAASYIGGVEDFYSYVGALKVKGSVEKTFYNLIQYGTGLGPLGVARGCFYLSRLGDVWVEVEGKARALRALGFIFDKAKERDRALQVLQENFHLWQTLAKKHLEPWQGDLRNLECYRSRKGKQAYLFASFIADFEDYRGHHGISKTVGALKEEVEKLFQKEGIRFRHSFIAQGYDGDLKPSHRNQRGRYARGRMITPIGDFEKIAKVSVEAFLACMNLDRKGSELLGTWGHTGMGGEIIPACYKATKINPHAPLVSSMETIEAFQDGDQLIFEVTLSNVEAGVFSTEEGLIPPVGREALRIIGIHSSQAFAAWLCGLVLASELNLFIEIARGALYRPK